MADEANEEVVQSSLEKALLAMEDDDSGTGALKTLADTSTKGETHDDEQGQGSEQGVGDEPSDGKLGEGERPGEQRHDGDGQDRWKEGQDELIALGKEHGIDLSKYKSRGEALKGLLNAARLVGQRNQLAETGKFVHENPQGALAWLREQLGEPEPTTKEVVDEGKKPEPADDFERLIAQRPDYDPEWENDLEPQEDGTYKERPGAEPGVLSKVQKFYRWKRKFDNHIAKDPEAPVRAALKKQEASHEAKIQAIRDEMEGIRLVDVQRQMQATAMNIFTSEKDWMFHEGRIEANNLTEAGVIFARELDDQFRSDVQRQMQATAMNIFTSEKDWMFHEGRIEANNLTEAGVIFARELDDQFAENPNCNVMKAIARAKKVAFHDTARKDKAAETNGKATPAGKKPATGNRGSATKTPVQTKRGGDGDAFPKGKSLWQQLMEDDKIDPARIQGL